MTHTLVYACRVSRHLFTCPMSPFTYFLSFFSARGHGGFSIITPHQQPLSCKLNAGHHGRSFNLGPEHVPPGRRHIIRDAASLPHKRDYLFPAYLSTIDPNPCTPALPFNPIPFPFPFLSDTGFLLQVALD